MVTGNKRSGDLALHKFRTKRNREEEVELLAVFIIGPRPMLCSFNIMFRNRWLQTPTGVAPLIISDHVSEQRGEVSLPAVVFFWGGLSPNLREALRYVF